MKTDVELRIERSTAMTCLKRAYLHLAQHGYAVGLEVLCLDSSDCEAAEILAKLHNAIGTEALEHDLVVAKGNTK